MTDIDKHFDISLNESQSKCANQLVDFIRSIDSKVFILKGYAGTGKTTMLRGVTSYLESDGRPYRLIATTGRAAKITSEITGVSVSTIHSQIYVFSDLDDDLEKVNAKQHEFGKDDKGQVQLLFDLKPIKSSRSTIYIVDESSMISDEVPKSTSFAKFGSGKLLYDLFAYDPNGKFLFVGDPFQLPPVSSSNVSPALDRQYLVNEYKFHVTEFELTEVMRQESQNGVLRVASNLRKLCKKPSMEKWAFLPVQGASNVQFHSSHVSFIASYIEELRVNGISQTTLICQSNEKCASFNRLIREALYQTPSNQVQVGDILLVTQNNSLCTLVNGDQVEVIGVGEAEFRCGLQFRNVMVKEVHSLQEHSNLIVENILFSKTTNLSHAQNKALLIDFMIRMRKEGISQKDPEFKIQMLEDPYLNALRAVFGYAITCHKSQGGEWPNVYLYLDNKIQGIPRATIYRWWYTAVSRAKQNLHLINDWFIS